MAGAPDDGAGHYAEPRSVAVLADRGIGIVKLMGRQSGFITVQASLAAGIVDVVLIPEVKFKLEGENGLMAYMETIMDKKGHCVLCVAEGAGQVSAQAVLQCTALQYT